MLAFLKTLWIENDSSNIHYYAIKICYIWDAKKGCFRISRYSCITSFWSTFNALIGSFVPFIANFSPILEEVFTVFLKIPLFPARLIYIRLNIYCSLTMTSTNTRRNSFELLMGPFYSLSFYKTKSKKLLFHSYIQLGAFHCLTVGQW